MIHKLIAAVAFLLTLLAPYRGLEPLYAGKPLAFWLDELKRDDPLIREEALAVLSDARSAARKATPAILKLSHHYEPSVRAASLTTLRFVAEPKEARQAAIQALHDDDPLVRCRAVVELRNVDGKHPDILPHALQLLKQPVGRSELLTLLGQMGPEAAPAVPALMKLLADTDPLKRRSAMQVLGRIGPAAQPAVPALLDQLVTADVSIRIEAVNALRVIGGDKTRIAAAVLEAAKRDESARAIYLILLADYGTKAAAAVPWLIEELHRSPSYATMQIAGTLYKIDRERARKEARPVLRKMLQSGQPWRVRAATALRQAEPDNDEALQTLIDCVAADQMYLRQEACQSLGTLGKSAAKAAPALRKALSDSQLTVRITAAGALWQIAGETDATVPLLLEALKPSPDYSSRYYAAFYLGQMGAALPKSALPQLRKFRDDAQQAVRDSVRRAIEQLEASAKDTKDAKDAKVEERKEK